MRKKGARKGNSSRVTSILKLLSDCQRTKISDTTYFNYSLQKILSVISISNLLFLTPVGRGGNREVVAVNSVRQGYNLDDRTQFLDLVPHVTYFIQLIIWSFYDAR